MMKDRTATIVVTIGLDTGVTRQDMRAYVEDEIKASFGGQRPEDPLFGTDRKSVKATLPHKDVAIAIGRCANPIFRRQMIAALKDNPVTKGWFE